MTRIPTIQELYTQCLSDLQTEFGVTISPFGKAFLRAFAATTAAVLKIYYLCLGNVQKNMLPITADPESVGGTLELWAELKGLTQRQATQGYYTVRVTGSIGATIPALTQFKSDDTALNAGYLYILDTAYTLVGTTDYITLRALTVGHSSLLAVGNTLTSTAPIIGVLSQGTVTVVVAPPIEAETLPEFRARILQSYRLLPQGGAPADYILWSQDALGVRTVYPYAANGRPNEIDVFVEAFPADSADGYGTPTSTELTAVANDIETNPATGKGRRPLGVFLVNVSTIILKDITITIDSGGTLTTAQQLQITNAINENMYTIRPFIAGADNVLTRNDTLNAFGIGTIIVNTVGSVVISSIVITVGATIVVSYQFTNGEIPKLPVGAITYL